MLKFKLSQPKEFVLSYRAAETLRQFMFSYNALDIGNKPNNFKVSRAIIDDKNLAQKLEKHINARVLRYICYVERKMDCEELDAKIRIFEIESGIESRGIHRGHLYNYNEPNSLYEKLRYNDMEQVSIDEVVANLREQNEKKEFDIDEELSFDFKYWDSEAVVKYLDESKSKEAQYDNEIECIKAAGKLTVLIHDSSVKMLKELFDSNNMFFVDADYGYRDSRGEEIKSQLGIDK
jgi:hypothetical protein